MTQLISYGEQSLDHLMLQKKQVIIEVYILFPCWIIILFIYLFFDRDFWADDYYIITII